MAELINVFEETERRAVAASLRNDTRSQTSGSNFASGSPAAAQPATFESANGGTLRPFMVDVDPVDDPNCYIS